MINLIPPQIKEKRLLKIVNAQIVKMFLGLLMIFGLLNLLIWIGGDILNLRLAISQEQVKSIEQEVSQYKDVEKKALGIKDRLIKAAALKKNQKEYSKILEALGNLTPTNVKLQTISLNEKDLNISGQASSEEEIVKFQHSLEQDKVFSDVYIQNSTLNSSETGTSVKFSLKIGLK